MNIFDQAMELEKEGESLYRQFALEAPDQGMRKIFTWLADREQEHYRVFKKWKEGEPAEVSEAAFLREVKDIFDGWKESSTCIDAKATQADLYRRALAIEIRSVEVYEKYAREASPAQKRIFQRIAAEEKVHERIVENIIEFITKPEFWVENAEFSHLDKDYYL